jgi:hypothetical protein
MPRVLFVICLVSFLPLVMAQAPSESSPAVQMREHMDVHSKPLRPYDSQKTDPARLSDQDLQHVAVYVAAVSAHLGGIVVVVLVLAIQELRRIQAHVHDQETELYRSLRDKSRLDMLQDVAIVSMSALMLNAIFVLLMLCTGVLSVSTIAMWSIGIFSFSIFCILGALVSYLILETPFMRVL